MPVLGLPQFRQHRRHHALHVLLERTRRRLEPQHQVLALHVLLEHGHQYQHHLHVFPALLGPIRARLGLCHRVLAQHVLLVHGLP